MSSAQHKLSCACFHTSLDGLKLVLSPKSDNSLDTYPGYVYMYAVVHQLCMYHSSFVLLNV